MATKIIGGIGKLLGGKKKKAAEAAAAQDEQKGPIIKQLGAPTLSPVDPRRRNRGLFSTPTILSDKLGG